MRVASLAGAKQCATDKRPSTLFTTVLCEVLLNLPFVRICNHERVASAAVNRHPHLFSNGIKLSISLKIAVQFLRNILDFGLLAP